MPATATKTVRLRVNEKRLPEILRNSFTSWENVLKELLQNARRAGATRILLSYEDEIQTLEIHDDGRGIANMQDLLHIAESGWDANLKAEEKTYGVGFMSALYAGEEITIESGTERLSFNTTRALSFHDLPVETLEPPVAGTRVRLRGFKVEAPKRMFPCNGQDLWRAAEYLGRTLERLVSGFPVPVYYNGKALERPFAMDSGKRFAPVSIGHIHLLDIHDTTDGKPDLEEGGTHATLVYLQGFPVAELDNPMHYASKTNIAHLDSSTFTARMPDRDVLINSKTQEERITAAIGDYWRDTLARELPTVKAQEVAETLYRSLERWNMLSALNDVPYLPFEAWEYAASRPLNTSGGLAYSTNNRGRQIAREDVEKGECVLLRDLFGASDIGYAYKTLAYQHNKKFVSLKTDALDKNHWAFKHAKPVQESDITVIINEPKKPHYYGGSWVSGDVILCKNMLFKTPHGDYTVDDCSIYTGAGEEAEEDVATFRLGKGGKEAAAGVFIIPANDHSPDEVIGEASNFSPDDNDASSEREEAEEKRKFRHFIASIKNTPPVKLLQDFLRRNLDMGLIPNTHGKSFALKISRKGEIRISSAGRGK